MLRHSVMTVALATIFGMPCSAHAADEKELAQIREQIQQLKDSYETRIRALEKRLQEAEVQAERKADIKPQLDAEGKTAESKPVQTLSQLSATPVPSTPPASVGGTAATASGFNPSVALILGGTYTNLSQDPQLYRLQGFLPSGDEVGPGKRSFSLGESELTFSANIDPTFSGQLTFSLASDNSASVEEAFFQTQGLSNGFNIKGGRFLSSIGYLNSQHAHAWDFVDAPLAYQAFFGGQYKPDGLQFKWLAPTERFFELGLEAGNGTAYPGNDRNKNGAGSVALFAHMGDDLGDSASWRAGLSYLHTGATNRSYDDIDHTGTTVTNAFNGTTNVWIADGIYKWSPNGNPVQTNFKLQGEYFRRKETGSMTYDVQAQSLGAATGSYAAAQSGWYLQSVYQFMPMWRTGLRYDKLYSGSTSLTLLTGDFQRLAAYNPTRTSVMLDYSPSEFSRFRLQLARDQSRPGVVDNQLFVQYIMSLGAHGAHTF
jgi:hypothetical protein